MLFTLESLPVFPKTRFFQDLFGHTSEPTMEEIFKSLGMDVDDPGYICEMVKNRLYLWCARHEKGLRNLVENVYFNIDSELVYHNFYCDFGPLNISCLYKYCMKLSDFLKHNPSKRIIHYTVNDENKRSNAAYLIGSFCIIYLGMHPKAVYKLLRANNIPIYRSFIDASQGGCSGCTIRLLEVLKGIYKAHIFGFFNFADFDIEAYDTYSSLKNGDLTWLLPQKFIAFIGPIDTPQSFGLVTGVNCHPASFYLNNFFYYDVRTVIRLNNKLYDESIFTNNGITHHDLYFTDGSSPTKDILLQFLNIAENANGAIAVHCKAGLGRTGSLIGAFLVKHYRMTAYEAIGWLRVCRPGCVIGQQQEWLHRVEKWLWHQGTRYRLDHFGEGDRIPHHRYGIYSVKWQDHRATLLRQTSSINKYHNRERSTITPPSRGPVPTSLHEHKDKFQVNDLDPSKSSVYQQFLHTIAKVTSPNNVPRMNADAPFRAATMGRSQVENRKPQKNNASTNTKRDYSSSRKSMEMKVLYANERISQNPNRVYNSVKGMLENMGSSLYKVLNSNPPKEKEIDEKEYYTVPCTKMNSHYRSEKSAVNLATSKRPKSCNIEYRVPVTQTKPAPNLGKYSSKMTKGENEKKRLQLLEKLDNYTSSSTVQCSYTKPQFSGNIAPPITQGDRLNALKLMNENGERERRNQPSYNNFNQKRYHR